MLLVGMALVVAAAISVPLTAPGVASASGHDATAFVGVAPCRLVDTRGGGGPLAPGATLDVAVAGRCGVTADAVAVAVTVTAVAPIADGHLTVFPLGSPRPLASSLNYRPGQSIAGSQLVAIAGGGISVFALGSTHLVVDVTGYFVPAPGGSRAGRYVVSGPRRLVDTRATGRPSAGGVVRVDPGVPPDAIAVAVHIATTETNGPDHLTAYAAGSPRPLASVLNVDGVGQTRNAGAIVPVGPGGFDVYTDRGNHVIVDLVGYFTGPSAPLGTDGLFVPAAPTRLLDTRAPRGPSGGPRIWGGGTRVVDPTLITGGPVAAVATTATMTATEDVGFVTLHQAGSAWPGTATVNADRAGATIAGLAIVPVATTGIAAYSIDGTHVVIDVTGWFLGDPEPDRGVVARNDPPPPRVVTIIGDSAIAGIRWNGALGGFQGFVARHHLESCRRLARPSCRGREGYRPLTVVDHLAVLPAAGPDEILLVATGYNDWHEGFAADLDAVIAAARGRGFRHVAWLTYRSSVGYILPGSGGTRSNYGEMNAILRGAVASGRYPELRIWDLDAYTVGATSWFTSDGVHETVEGSWGVADYVSRHVRAFDEVPCAQPWRPGEPVPDACPNPDAVLAARGRADVVALYGL